MSKLMGATVVFDLDGTLVDTAPDIRSAINIVMAEVDLPELDLLRVRGLIGHGARGLFEKVFREAGRAVTAPELDDLADRFLVVYGANIARESRPYPGLEDALDELARSGARLAVCTNKRDVSTASLLDALDLTRRFRAVATPETAGAAKPDPAHLLAAIARAGGHPDRAVMVGDSAADAEAARGACVPLILVDFGYCEGGASALKPDVLISHFRELPGAVARLLGAGAPAIAPSPAMDA